MSKKKVLPKTKVGKPTFFQILIHRDRLHVAGFLFTGVLIYLLVNAIHAEPASPCTGPVVRLTGNTSTKYDPDTTANGTTFDRTGWLSNTIGNTSSTAFYVGHDAPHPTDVCVLNGVIFGHIPLDWSWNTTHDYGGAADRTVTTNSSTSYHARIHNTEDGVKFRERDTGVEPILPYLNTSRFSVVGAYMTGIRDDAIENDDFMPGRVEDSLFDGIWTLYSEQLQTAGPNTTIGENEDTNVYLDRIYARLYTTNGQEIGGGKWFKIQGAVPHHQIHVSDSVLAVDKQPRSGWSSLSIPPEVSWSGTNYILWLGDPGTYGGPKPSGVIYMEGQPARDKWNEIRNTWLTSHGYEAKPEDDWNPMDDPVIAPSGTIVVPIATPISSPVPIATIAPTVPPLPTATPVVADQTLPVVAITYPLISSVVRTNTTVTITANASDNLGVSKVLFYIDNKLKCSDTTSPYSCTWKTSRAKKTYVLKAVAYDLAGNTDTSIVNVTTQ